MVGQALADNSWARAEGNDGEKPISITFMVSPPNEIEISDYPNLVVIKWHYDSPNEYGMPFPEDFEKMKVMENALTKEFDKTKQAILMHTFLGLGVREYYFYSKDKAGFDSSLNSALSSQEQYPITITNESDPEWETYFNLRRSLQ